MRIKHKKLHHKYTSLKILPTRSTDPHTTPQTAVTLQPPKPAITVNSPTSATFFSKTRKRSKYFENYSAALALPFSLTELTAQNNDIETFRPYILEHARRRVDLFFYTLIAYYDSKAIPIASNTHIQHGRGRNTADEKSLTQACHSSITPALVELDEKSQVKASRLENTHFMDSLNATIELPSYINELDEKIEQHYQCRHKAIEILREVALGKLNPIQGLEQFLIFMHKTFNTIEKNLDALCLSKQIDINLIKLMRSGTFTTLFDENTKKINDDYLFMIFRLPVFEKLVCQVKPENTNKIFTDMIFKLQLEILEAKSTFPRKSLGATPP